METWQIYHAARKLLPKGKLQSIYSRPASLIGLWAADPTYCEHTTRNPLDRIRIMLNELDTAGAGDYARYAIDYMAEPLGGHFAPFAGAESDKGSVDGEAVDIHLAVADLVTTARDALSDGRISVEERVRIGNAARAIQEEVNQLLDVLGMMGGE